ncbi:unnamed protein product [Paramecium primaurelia]|uniref:Uncharacterized protein n=1 Tax=Paramecium primaurelia TaxID=5886 RepID=A0A8S1QV38_PARPR|nr:unnamed protein product [Paramecium primaurelia]
MRYLQLQISNICLIFFPFVFVQETFKIGLKLFQQMNIVQHLSKILLIKEIYQMFSKWVAVRVVICKNGARQGLDFGLELIYQIKRRQEKINLKNIFDGNKSRFRFYFVQIQTTIGFIF